MPWNPSPFVVIVAFYPDFGGIGHSFVNPMARNDLSIGTLHGFYPHKIGTRFGRAGMNTGKENANREQHGENAKKYFFYQLNTPILLLSL